MHTSKSKDRIIFQKLCFSFFQVRRINNQGSCVHCVVTLGFLGVHSIMNIFYSIPLAIVAFSVNHYETEGSLAFIQLNAVGILSGIVFAVMETRRPWPIVRSLGPFYLYEVCMLNN